MDVVSVEMPHKVLSEIKATSHIRIREKLHATGGEAITVEVQCPDVPGWVVSRSTKLLDKDARVVQRTTLELVDFDAKPTEPQVAAKPPKGERARDRRRNKRKRRTAAEES